jgi:hypothetical protein
MINFGCKTGVEKAWLVASLTALALHHLLKIEPAADWIWVIEGAMIVLSFPFGPLAMLFILLGVEVFSGPTNFSWLLDWSTMLLIGYIQWFWVLPEMMKRNNETITLNLNSPAATSPVETSSVETSPIETSTLETSSVETSSVETSRCETLPVRTLSPAPLRDSLTLSNPAPAVFDAAAFLPPFTEFDEAGLTALDRVLRAHKTSTLAPDAPPAGVESIS